MTLIYLEDNVSADQVNDLIGVLANDKRVKEVKEVKITRDNKARKAFINIKIIDKGEEELFLKEVVDLG